MDIGLAISAAAVAVSILAMVGGMVYWAGKVSERIDAMSARIDARIDALATEVAETRRELLAAISYHEHDTDGSIRFRVPPPAV